MVPKKIFYTKGVGVHKEKLASFEMALRVAGLAHCNLVLVSSIYPPGCKIIPKEEGLKLLRPGEIVFAVYDRESYNEPNRLIAASVGLAIPADSSMHGYLSEHHSFGETDEKAGEYAEDLDADERERYRTANREALRYAAALERRFVAPEQTLALLAEVRRFYRMDLPEKLGRIAQLA